MVEAEKMKEKDVFVDEEREVPGELHEGWPLVSAPRGDGALL